MKNEIVHHNGGVMFAGPKAVNVLACITVAHAMKQYVKTGMKASRNYTPTNMLAFVKEQTGKQFKRSQMMEAAEYLLAFAQSQRVTINETWEG